MKIYFSGFTMLILVQNIFGQASTPGNAWNLTPNEYLGWDIASNTPLNIKTEANQPMRFYTNAGIGGFANMKMSIMRRTINATERGAVAIQETGGNTIVLPRSILHLGQNYFSSGFRGWRTWMDIGTFCDQRTDYAYFGIMEQVGDTITTNSEHNDAVIAWGDNLNGGEGADNLRVIFAGPFGSGGIGRADTWLAAEVARFTPTGRVGIGNFATNGSNIQPLRRLEVYDDNLDPLYATGNPQLRLTYTPNGNVNNGIWTDFQTTVNGDLFIHPSVNLIDASVGINTATPLAALNVNGTNVNANAGNVFRTDGAATVTQTWAMYKGTLEEGRFFNPGTSNNFTIQASQNHLNFNSGNGTDGLEAMRIVGGNGTRVRFVGIGNYSNPKFSVAQNQLHQFIDSTANVYHQFSNGNTTIGASVSANESFKLGITYNAITAKSDAELISQQQGAAMNFYTTSNLIAANRMTITSIGNVGINTLTPNSYLEINTAIPVATGSSGLQFTDLTTSSFLNNSFFTGVTKGVLSVDDNGRVVLVKDENGTPSNGITACTSPGINAVNFLTKISGTNQICKSGVYEDPTSNYVGIGNTFPQAKLHVQSTITNTAAGYIGALVDLDVTYNAGAGGNATDVGLFVSSKANTADGNVGVNATVTGGVKDCRGFNANVNNPNGSFNYGYYSNLKDNSTTTNISPLNIGFASFNETNTLAGTNATNIGFSSSLGILNQHSLGTMTGLHTVNRGGENSYGANLEVYNSTSPTAICFGIKAFTGPDYQCINCKPAKNYASNFIANQGQEVYGAYIEANDGSVKNYGILAITNSNNSAAADYYGVSGIVNVTYAVNKPKNSYGGNFVSTGATNESFGVKAVALGGDNMNYAVYASVAGSGCTSSSGCNNWAGYFNGSTFSSGLYLPSDSNLKRNIKSIPNALSLINQLNPKEFNYKKSIINQLSLPEGEHYGFLAQDVQTTLPGLVKETRQPAIVDSAGNVIKHGFNFLAINYEEIIPLLVDVVQQQQQQIDSLINGMAANNQPKMANPNAIEVTLSNQKMAILNVNEPNPFKENTTINYFIPENVTTAQLLFYDNTGTVLKSVDIKEKGQGSILIYGSNLSSGLYTYSLLADGKLVSTQRMVKVK